MTSTQNSPNTMSMDELMAQYSMPAVPVRGTLIQGTVFRNDPKMGAWIDFGGKCEALVPHDEIGDAELTAGQSAMFFVLSTPEDDDGIGNGKQWTGPVFSAKRARSWNSMQENLDQRTTLSVKVTRVARNGTGGIAGLNVIAGDLHGFVPYSMLAAGGKTIDTLIGAELDVKVVQVEPDKRKLIFNHREVMAERAAETQRRREELFASLTAGVVLPGKIVRLVDYGCFVDVGEGLHGLVHRSELSGDTKIPVSELVKPGDQVEVKVLRAATVDGKRQLALSVKQVRQASFLSQLQVGDTVPASVSRLTAFGCFVELSPEHGVDGLIHKSQYSSAVRNGRKTLTAGESLLVKVIELDVAKGRVGLTLKEVAQPAVTENASQSEDVASEDAGETPAA